VSSASIRPLLNPLGVAGGTETAGAAGEHGEPLLPPLVTADASKAAPGVNRDGTGQVKLSACMKALLMSILIDFVGV